MAATRLSDLTIVPSVFTASMTLESLALDAFVQSGVMVEDAAINAFLNGDVGGKKFEPRFIGPLPDSDPNISTDDPAVKAVPEKITGLKNSAVRQSLNKSWSSMDLAADLYGADPMGAITSQVAKYWLGVRTRRVLSSLKGVIADNVANDAGDMVVDVSAGTGAAALFSADAFLDAAATMGDRASSVTAIGVHHVVYTTMQKLNLIDFIPDARGEVNIPTYMGKRVIVDDAMTSAGGKYYSYLFGAGAIAFGQGASRVPVEIERIPDAGNGGGQEVFYSRVEYIIHPQGFEYALSDTPTTAQLEAAASWSRAWERKRVPLACLITAG